MLTQIGRYELIRPLGRGGMGQVFLARDPRLERRVAIKLLQHESGPARDLFQKEAKALAALSHPNIVTIFEIAEADAQHYIAMEYLPGKPLRELLLDRPPRDDVIAICAHVAAAVDAAHAAGILHRDIKPENVMVGERVKVVDFGIARHLDVEAPAPVATTRMARAQSIVDVFTQTVRLGDDTLDTTVQDISAGTQTVFGTPAYMAPEVLKGQPSSRASDVYSLGVMLHECLTGTRPHDCANLVGVIARAIGDDPPPVIDDPLGPLVAQMLDRDPDKRPLLSTVSRALTRRGSTVSASTRRRRRWLVVALAAITVLAVGVAALTIWKSRSRDRGTVAIRTFSVVEIPSYGAQKADARAMSSVIAMLVESAGVSVMPPEAFDKKLPPAPRAEDWESRARAEGASLLADAQIVEANGMLTTKLVIVHLGSGETETKEITSDATDVPRHIDLIVEWIADTVHPGAKLDHTLDNTRARALLDRARPLVRDETFPAARTFAEQAVHTDESYYEAWELLARILRSMQAPAATTRKAITGALARAPDGPRKQLMRAQLLREDDRPVAALALLVPLETATLPETTQRDLLYELGEAHWHQGHHDLAYRYFQRALSIDSGFTVAASHAGEYALARRKLDDARLYLGIQHITFEWADFAAGNYEQLAASGHLPFSQWSLIVLGRADFTTLYPDDPVSTLMNRITTAAVIGDEAAASHAVDELLALFKRSPSGGINSYLTHMAEVTISAQMREPTRRLLDALRAVPHYNYKRIAILASPLLGKQAFDRSELTDRLRALEAAYDAELAGDHALAADRLSALIADPTFEWEFVERATLIRILRDLGRTQDADALCAATMKPVILRYAYAVLRSMCVR